MLEQVQALQVSRQVRQREPWQEPVQARSRASPERLQEQVQALQVSRQVRRREPWQEQVKERSQARSQASPARPLEP